MNLGTLLIEDMLVEQVSTQNCESHECLPRSWNYGFLASVDRCIRELD